jgi:hypothetical protein
MSLTTPAALMAAFLATVILAMRLAVLYPHPKVAETSETTHPEMVVILQKLGEATGGLKIELGHNCDSNDKFIHLIGSKHSFPQSFLGANSYLMLAPCSPLFSLVQITLLAAAAMSQIIAMLIL